MSKLHQISIKNFKAFREFDFDLEGKHLLLYGPNGSGKSSLYWSLYTFLQSASKPHEGKLGISKYFSPDEHENLLNHHEQESPDTKPGSISLSFHDADNQIEQLEINENHHGTHNKPLILKGDLASDFVTYRFFFGFSHYRNSQNFDMWPLFEREILPFCVSTSGASPLACWKRIELGTPNPHRLKGVGGSNAYDRFAQATYVFAGILPEIVDTISAKAQEFYKEHFSSDDSAKVTLKLKVTQNAYCEGTSKSTFRFKKPVISFGVQVNGKNILRPQSFFNEAKMTQLALSIRFAASLVNLHDSEVKLYLFILRNGISFLSEATP